MPVTGNNPSKLSVRFGQNGFTYQTNDCARSEWLSAEFVFCSDIFQRSYEEVVLSAFLPRYTLVPANWFDETRAQEYMDAAFTPEEGADLRWNVLPAELGAVEIWTPDKSRLTHIVCSMLSVSEASILPEFHFLLTEGYKVDSYNKIIASYAEGRLYLVIFQGKNLMLCNSFEAPDFTTAQYYIFRMLKNLQLNPEASTIYFRTPLTAEEEMSLYHYFQAVKSL
ncbi:MAG: DUF3822 family protein [Bacteroidales bacterium]|nr:DUF3822 family protein [Bacteroidales bacterium]